MYSHGAPSTENTCSCIHVQAAAVYMYISCIHVQAMVQAILSCIHVQAILKLT